jgi:SNF2 family DNA or RNA helicase
MLAAGTIDEDIYDLIEKKRAVVDAAIEGGEVSDENSTVQMIMRLFEKLN